MTENKQNRLIHEKSPYLLQHASNPVDWYPWCDEAFEKAGKENKPVFLSIGYSTCHWCHVMAHESFEDSEVALLMNETFVSIKVDREERPDIDGIYMTVCQVMTGGGGWPLTIIMTQDKKPFFAGTYIPKENRYGRSGMMELIPEIKKLWRDRHDDVLNTADNLTEALKRLEVKEEGEKLGIETLRKTYEQLAGRFDHIYGGFGRSPKFPTPHNLLFLLRYWKKYDEPMAMEMVEKTLKFMRLGGVYDHIGYGFHRYSTDDRWFLPHFEKMLYDQALLAMIYTEAYQATGKEEYKHTAHEIFTYVLRDMTSQKGGFYSAEDADSEGVEGKFYLWREEDILTILGKDEGELFIKIFNVTKEGNFHEEIEGGNILYLKKPIYETAIHMKISEKDLGERLEKSIEKLFQERKKRIHPHKDDKILTDWNGLMIAALSKGAQIFDEPAYLDAAHKATKFILEHMYKEGRLLHRYREGSAGITGNIDDYAFFIRGLLELYETDFDVKHLKTAIELNDTLVKHFWDDKGGAFYFTPDDGESLLVRQKEIYDGAIPSGNSVSMLNLLQLGRITGNSDYEKKAERIGNTFSREVNQLPLAHAQLMVGLDFAAGPSHEVVIVGDFKSEDTKDILNTLRRRFLPDKIVILKSDEKERFISDIAEFTKNLTVIDNKSTVYVCSNYACKLPVTDKNKMMELLEK
jgi:uncharacterized protein YyaL (SSP411 family)